MNFKISKIQHVGIPVTNLEKSIEFYTSLGFTNVMQSTFDHDDGTGNVAMMQSGDVVMELYEFPEPAVQDIAARKDGHVDHVAFDVDDIDAVFNELKDAGYKIFEDALVFLDFWDKGCKYFNIEGPDGERLEFNQIMK